MKRAIHFFDLDRTLWSIGGRVWVIDKNQPNKPLIKLSTTESTYVLKGVYKKDENMIDYNGESFWISDKMIDKIKLKRKNIELSDLGVSFTEHKDPKYFDNVKIFVENIRHLLQEDDTKFDIGILSARHSVENDNKILNALKEKLNDLGLSINKFYYTNDYFKHKNTNKDNIDKMNIVLEHLVGFHIEDSKFVPIKQDLYNEIHFYDDEYQNINVMNDIQTFFEEYLKNTEDELFNRIVKNLTNTHTLYTHLITNNSLKRFKTTKIELKQPIKFSIRLDESKIIKNFENFRTKRY